MKSPKLTVILIAVMCFIVLVMHLKLVTSEEKASRTFQLKRSAGTGDASGSEKAQPSPSGQEGKAQELKEKMPLSAATVEDIMEVSGFGEKMAARLAEKIREKGDSITEDDVLSVSGIGDARLASLKERFIIPAGAARKDAILSPQAKTGSISACPRCGKDLSDHERKPREDYIYCPHCLKYLPEKQGAAEGAK
jgi:DNA uptake protein ComE-like DNA-binding protein